MKRDYLAKKIEVALLKPETTKQQILDACKKVREYKFGSFVVNPWYVNLIKSQLKNTDTRIVSVMDFPFGASGIETKELQAHEIYMLGVDDIDMVMNVGALKSKDYETVAHEIHMVKEAIKSPKSPTLKVIIETALLTKKEVKKAAEICVKLGADYVKTNTGFFTRERDLTTEVKLIRKYTKKYNKKIKASAGIRDIKLIEKLEKLGVDKYGIGLESAMEILDGLKE